MPIHSRLPRQGAAALGFPALLAALVSCADSPTPTATEERRSPDTTMTAGPELTTTLGTIPLPIFQGVTSSGTALGIVQNGTGTDGYFLINNVTSTGSALRASTTGLGRAGDFFVSNTGSFGPAIYAATNGRGPAGEFVANSATSFSPARVRTLAKANGVRIDTDNTANSLPTLEAWTQGTGKAGYFRIDNANNLSEVLTIITEGTGVGLSVDHLGPQCTATSYTCNLAIFRNNNANKIRFNRQGKGFFNGGTQTSGADVAEAFAVEGRSTDYEPGDVLVISTRSDQRVERSRSPYSTLVAGVYATKPGLLLTERHIDDNLDDTVPLGVIGVIPTKVSA